MEVKERYVIETTDKGEAQAMLNIENIMSALYDVKEWKQHLYKHYENDNLDVEYLYKGKLYNSLQEIEEKEDTTAVIKVENVEKKLDEILNKIDHIIQQYYE